MTTPSGDARCQVAVILAAGRGKRMGALTDDAPKCLCALAGRPVLSWTIEALRANGIEEIVAVGGWQHQALDGWVDRVLVNSRWQHTNMVRSLLVAGDWLRREDVLVVYGDGAYGARAIGAALDGIGDDIVVPIDREWRALWQRRFLNPLDDAETLTREGTRLTGIGSHAVSLDQIQGQFMGLLRTSPRGWTRIAKWIADYESMHSAAAVDRLDTTTLLQRLLETGESIACVEVDGGWVEIDSANDIAAAEETLTKTDAPHDFRR